MGKRGPKPGSKWHWYVIKRVSDGMYYVNPPRRFGPLGSARSWRLRPAFSTLCRLRRYYRTQERKHRKLQIPETFVLEVKGNPRSRVNYPWRMPS